MKEDKNFFIVDKSVLPEIFLKVMDVKNLLESKKEKTVQDAVNRVGISRSAFYKYRDAVHPLYENTRGKTVTIATNLDNTPGLLFFCITVLPKRGAQRRPHVLFQLGFRRMNPHLSERVFHCF